MHLFEDELKEIYRAENVLLKALPIMIENSTCSELKDAFTSHLKETKEQVANLKEVFITFGKKAAAEKCDAISDLISEAETIINDCEAGSSRDAGIISTAEKIENCEIETYGTLRQFFDLHGMPEAIRLLKAHLEEEKISEEKLKYEGEPNHKESK